MVSIMAVVAVLLIHIERKEQAKMMPSRVALGLPLVRLSIAWAKRISSPYFCIRLDSTKPPRNSKIILEKNGAKKTELDTT